MSDLVLAAVGGAQAARRDLLDAVGDQRDVLAVEGGQVVVGEARALAAEAVARGELVAHLGVVDLVAKVLAARALAELGQRENAVEVRGQGEGQLHEGLAGHPPQQAGAREAVEAPFVARLVGLGQAPDRRALEDGEVLDLGGDRRDHLHRGGAGADDRHPPAAQVLGVVPAGGVHERAGEAVEPVDVRRLGLGEDAGGADHVAGGDGPATGAAELPEVGLLVEGRAGDLGVQHDALAQAVAVHAALGVVLELLAGRVGLRPVVALLEGELVAGRRDVDADARVGVPVPGAADAVAGLEQDRVAEARPVERDGGADAGEPGADDRYFVIRPSGQGLIVRQPRPAPCGPGCDARGRARRRSSGTRRRTRRPSGRGSSPTAC